MSRRISVPLWVIPAIMIAFVMGWLLNVPLTVARAQSNQAPGPTPTVNKKINAGRVNNLMAGDNPKPGKLLALDGSGKFPLAVIPQGSGSGLNSDKVDSYDASLTPTAGQLLPLNSSKKFPVSAIPQGTGSGLDADKLDGNDSTAFVKPADVMPNVLAHDGSGSGLDADKLDGNDSTAFVKPADIMPVVLANDGSGSGVDADTLDGYDVSYFLKGYVGTQIQGHVDPGGNQYWSTFGYSTNSVVVWQALPTTTGGHVKLDVETQYDGNGSMTYYLRVTNLGGATDYNLVRWTIYQ